MKSLVGRRLLVVIDILNETDFNFSQEYENIIHNVIKKSLEAVNFTAKTEVSVCVVTNEQIKQLNSEFRGINKETDVLSFPMLTFENKDYNLELNTESSLGDIVISIEKAISQAEEYGHSLAREIAFLTAHSMLHLLGYDHENEDEEKLMFSVTEKILNELGYTR